MCALLECFLNISFTLTTSLLFNINYQVLTTIVSTVTYRRAPLFKGYKFRKCAEKGISRKLFSQIYIGDGGRPLLRTARGIIAFSISAL